MYCDDLLSVAYIYHLAYLQKDIRILRLSTPKLKKIKNAFLPFSLLEIVVGSNTAKKYTGCRNK